MSASRLTPKVLSFKPLGGEHQKAAVFETPSPESMSLRQFKFTVFSCSPGVISHFWLSGSSGCSPNLNGHVPDLCHV